MSCEICGRGGCTRSFHSLEEQTLEDWLNEEIEVCDKCLRACCWHGLFMCDDSAIAGTIKKKRRDLVALGLEHSDYMVVDGESEHLYVTPKPETTARELLGYDPKF